MTSVRLGELTLGQLATVLSIDETVHHREELLERGLVPGTTVAVAAAGAVGRPMVIAFRGILLALRRDRAQAVRVAPRPMMAPSSAGDAKGTQKSEPTELDR